MTCNFNSRKFRLHFRGIHSSSQDMHMARCVMIAVTRLPLIALDFCSVVLSLVLCVIADKVHTYIDTLEINAQNLQHPVIN